MLYFTIILLLSNIYCKQSAVIFILCRNSDLQDLSKTLKNFEKKINHKIQYPYVIVNNEDFTENFKNEIKNVVSTSVEFGKICEKTWERPSYIDIEKAKIEWDKMAKLGIPYANMESYHNMCRYFSRSFYDHPLVKNYKYYWRIEPGVEFHCEIDEDPFDYLEKNNKLYGFTITLHEFMETIKTLEKVVNDYIIREKITLPHEYERLNFMFPNDKFNGCHFWSNFEIASFDLFRSDSYRKFVDELEKQQGFYMERWGDAPVHSIYIGKFIDKIKVHFFENIGYTHPPFTHCPSKCKNSTCKDKVNFDYHPASCLPLYFKDVNNNVDINNNSIDINNNIIKAYLTI